MRRTAYKGSSGEGPRAFVASRGVYRLYCIADGCAARRILGPCEQISYHSLPGTVDGSTNFKTGKREKGELVEQFRSVFCVFARAQTVTSGKRYELS